MPSPVFQVMVVIPGSSPAGTGFGEAVIIEPDGAGLAGDALTPGFSEGLQPAKKQSGRRTATVRLNRFIKIFRFVEFLDCFISSHIPLTRLTASVWSRRNFSSHPKASTLRGYCPRETRFEFPKDCAAIRQLSLRILQPKQAFRVRKKWRQPDPLLFEGELGLDRP